MSDINDQTIWDEKAILKRTDEICGNVVEILRATAPSALDERSAAVRNSSRQEMSVRGVLPRNAEQMLDDIETKEGSDLDKHLQVLAMEGVLKPVLELEEALARTEKHHQVLRPAARYDNAELRLLARIADGLERQEARATMTGKTLSELTKIYEAASDEDRGAFVAFVEEEQSLGFTSLKYAPTTSLEDAAAMLALSRAIAARKEARTPIFIKEVRARMAATLDDLSRDRIKKIGRGTAHPVMDHFKNSVAARERGRAERLAV
jgi:hypothetical protein